MKSSFRIYIILNSVQYYIQLQVLKTIVKFTNSVASKLFFLWITGGDYLVEITGKFLNVYGQGSLRYIDKPWNQSKSNDVTTVKFNYVSFNSLVPVFSKIKNRFPNAENYFFRDTNIYCLGQLNALADLQGLVSLYIHEDGNPITHKEWHPYAIYRLSHWGLKLVNDNEVCEPTAQ